MSRNNRCFQRFNARLFAFLGSEATIFRFSCAFEARELKLKGKRKKLEEKLSDRLKRRFVSRGKSSLSSEDWFERGSPDRGECADRRRSVGWARSGIWSVARWVDGRYVGVATPAPARSSQVVAMQSGRVSCRMPRQQLAVTLFRGPRPAARIDPPPLPIVVTPRATPFQAASNRIATVSLPLLHLRPPNLFHAESLEENRPELSIFLPFYRFSASSCFSTRSQLRILSTRGEKRGSFATLRSIFFCPFHGFFALFDHQDRCKSSSSSSCVPP